MNPFGAPPLEKTDAFFETLRDYQECPAYHTPFNPFIDFPDHEQICFIWVLDNKLSIEDLEWMISTRLKQQYNLNLNLNLNLNQDLPNPEQYPKMSSVSLDGVLRDLGQALGNSGFQLSFIDTRPNE